VIRVEIQGHRTMIGRRTDWALLGEVLMCMPQLQKLSLKGLLRRLNSIAPSLKLMTGQYMDDEGFLVVAEGLASLSKLGSLVMPKGCSLRGPFSSSLMISRWKSKRFCRAGDGRYEGRALAAAGGD
jgi:hypothetical protein